MSANSLFIAFLLLLSLFAINANAVSYEPEIDVVQMARSSILHSIDLIKGLKGGGAVGYSNSTAIITGDYHHHHIALQDCVKLYEDSELRLGVVLELLESENNYNHNDVMTWLSAALASHTSCLDGLEEKGWTINETHQQATNLTIFLKEALALHSRHREGDGPVKNKGGVKRRPNSSQSTGLLASWNEATTKADFVVAQDGSGNFKTINEAITALAKMDHNRPERTIVYVKSGVYRENVEIGRDLKNVMFVGDGMDKTIVTGNRNVQDGATTISSATFGVFGDGFWARDMTFENSAGPEKYQAVALRVSSDLSIFYQCSIKGYQDTLLVHSLRQFYRDCHIYGTIDFIFGDAVAVFQNCDIFVRRPLNGQGNMITAQARDDPNENTGFSILNSRVRPAPEFTAVKNKFNNFLGRPWKRYSRTVYLKTDLDGLVHPEGWGAWNGDFALSTLYYGEYMNTGDGASTARRVKWPGFHVLHDPREATLFTARNFIQGDVWISGSGVPYSADI